MPFLLPTAHTNFLSEHFTLQTTPPACYNKQSLSGGEEGAPWDAW